MSVVAGRVTNSGSSWIEVAGKRYTLAYGVGPFGFMTGHSVTLVLDFTGKVIEVRKR